jgi:predicted transcriptional regulator
MKTYRLSVRVDEETRSRLEQRARIEVKDESVVIREALEAYLSSERESVHDALKRVGGLGMAKGLPSDLSTGRRHFEGFGVHEGPRRHRSARRTLVK